MLRVSIRIAGITAVAALATMLGWLFLSNHPAGATTIQLTPRPVTAAIGTRLDLARLAPARTYRANPSGDFQTIVETGRVVVPTGVEDAIAAACPKNYVATGGGAGIGGLSANGPLGVTNAYVTADGPYAGPNKPIANGQTATMWLSVVTNASGSNQNQFVWVICSHS